jgi:hypothetical protein
VTVLVSGLNPDAGIHVVLGDQEVAKGTTDSKGEAEVEFQVPSQTGRRLVTVGNDGTALTADCTLGGRGTPPEQRAASEQRGSTTPWFLAWPAVLAIAALILLLLLLLYWIYRRVRQSTRT